MHVSSLPAVSRRAFIKSAQGLGAVALASLLRPSLLRAAQRVAR